MYEGQDSQNNLSIHPVCCSIAFYECDDAISHICKKYFGRSGKCVNLPIWGVGFYFQYGGTMARQRGKPTMYTLPHPQYTASSAVPCASACGNLCGKPPTWWCLLASCVPRRVSNVPIVGWSRIAKHTERYFRINPDILPKDFPLPNKIWLSADFVKNVPQVDPRCIALPPNADRSHWKPRPMLAELLSQPGKLDENITNTSYKRKLRWINISKTRYIVCIKVSTYYQCETFQMFF